MQKLFHNRVYRLHHFWLSAPGRFGLTSLMTALIVLTICSCEGNLLKSEYVDLGQFDSRNSAERNALAHLADQYAALPTNKTYKAMYHFDADPGVGTLTHTHAIWYNKTNQELSIEVSIQSGMSCGWTKVDQSILNQLVTANRGYSFADSLVPPLRQRGYSDCYLQ